MKKLRVLVNDSFHTASIAASLRKFFGDKAICYEVSCPPTVKIDLFVLSGMNVRMAGPEALVARMKKQGSKKCQVLVTSAVEDILDELKANEIFNIKFTILKSELVSDLPLADTGPKTKKVILNQILAIFAPQAPRKVVRRQKAIR